MLGSHRCGYFCHVLSVVWDPTYILPARFLNLQLGGIRPDLKVLDGFQSGLAGMITGYLGMRGQWAAAGAK